MLNKSKQLLIGFILGIFVLSVVPIYAAVQEYVLQLADYKLLVDGVEYTDTEQPLLNYQGSTYIPLRKVSDILGVKLNWNAELCQAEIVQNKTKPTNKTNIELIDGFNVYSIDNSRYIEYGDIRRSFDNNDFYPYILYVGKNFV